ncbi:hypothetical protein DFJ74DRAFT_687598 [Hyaloraphidium curvatum]|nr:hypothetical protein DFJ74DRAFT_687598 [Hyaloraphidium curvatum]
MALITATASSAVMPARANERGVCTPMLVTLTLPPALSAHLVSVELTGLFDGSSSAPSANASGNSLRGRTSGVWSTSRGRFFGAGGGIPVHGGAASSGVR